MADPFMPRFVDLVRNFTTTAGTGDLVLGSPAPGFTGFAEALQPGDQFYYSVVGLARTEESEVGRGTLTAEGAIARDPIGGVATDFSSGPKSVALVAAAEWFESIESVRGAPVAVASRSALAALVANGAALLSESGREGLFVFDGSDLSGRVSADTAQGLCVAPTAAPTGASGAWVRQFSGPVQAKWWGWSTANAAAANDSAISAMFTALDALRFNAVGGFGGLWDIDLGPGSYATSQPIKPPGACTISGRGKGHGPDFEPAGSTRILPSACHGFVIEHRTISIRELGIDGDFSGTEGEHHGVYAIQTPSLERLNIRNMRGDGVFIVADTSVPGQNANNWLIYECEAWNCRDGFRFDGDNANAGTMIGGRALGNRRAGINDDSMLGNTFIGVSMGWNGFQAVNNGVAIPAAAVSHGGHHYGVIAGQEAGASTNAPSGTTADNGWWYYIETKAPVAGAPAWFSGISLRAGGAILDTAITARNAYQGCYSEYTGPKSQISQRSIVSGGDLAVWCFQNPAANKGTGIIRGGTSNGEVVIEPDLVVKSGAVTAQLGDDLGNPNLDILSGYHASAAPNRFILRFNASVGSTTFNDGTSVIGQMTTSATTHQFGTGVAVPAVTYFGKLAIGPSAANARIVTVDEAAPVSGNHGQGEFVHYRGASANLLGWKCTGAGTPGTWEGLYGLTQLKAAGSGLTVSASDVLLGRSSADAGAVEEIACTQAGRALIAAADEDAQRAAVGVVRAIAFHCSGAPLDGEVVAGAIAPYPMTLSATNSRCKALVAASADIAFEIKKNGAVIGSIAFVAGSAAAALSFTDPSVAAGDQITVHNGASADVTLADIDGLLCE